MSNHEKLVKTIQPMLYKCWMFNTVNYKFTGFEITDNFLIVNTDNGTLDIPLQYAIERLRDFLPVQEPSAIELSEKNIVTFNGDLRKILFEQIQRVKDNPENIKQAQAITNMVNSMLNSVKLELSLYKTMQSGVR